MSDLGGRRWAPIAVPLGIAAFVAAGWFVVTSGPGPAGPPGTPEGAVESCKVAVSQRLSRPDTATFTSTRWTNGGTVWEVSGVVAVTARDGTSVEAPFQCWARRTSGEVTELTLPGGL
jgi:hypothetical protein